MLSICRSVYANPFLREFLFAHGLSHRAISVLATRWNESRALPLSDCLRLQGVRSTCILHVWWYWVAVDWSAIDWRHHVRACGSEMKAIFTYTQSLTSQPSKAMCGSAHMVGCHSHNHILGSHAQLRGCQTKMVLGVPCAAPFALNSSLLAEAVRRVTHDFVFVGLTDR